MPIPDCSLFPLLLTVFTSQSLHLFLLISPYHLPAPFSCHFHTLQTLVPPRFLLRVWREGEGATEGEEKETRKATCPGTSPLLLAPHVVRQQQQKKNEISSYGSVTGKNIGNKKVGIKGYFFTTGGPELFTVPLTSWAASRVMPLGVHLVPVRSGASRAELKTADPRRRLGPWTQHRSAAGPPSPLAAPRPAAASPTRGTRLRGAARPRCPSRYELGTHP